MKETLKCEYCGAENRQTPIIQKPIRIGYKGKIVNLPQVNPDGRSQDNICLPCFEAEVEKVKSKTQETVIVRKKTEHQTEL